MGAFAREGRAVRTDGPMPVRAELLAIRSGGRPKTWSREGQPLGRLADLPLQSLGRLWRRSGAGKKDKNFEFEVQKLYCMAFGDSGRTACIRDSLWEE
ncbi:MAG: hypothetical protein JWQ71_1294 [Pedosphaera sp.]|nr:hypothetical protein [Pedosphaera sp.]